MDGVPFTNYDPDIRYLSVTDAIAKSVNICMIKVAQDAGSNALRQTLSRFGFDMNIPWDNENSDALNLANATLGSSIPVTVGGLTKAYTILANKGHLLPKDSQAVVSEVTANTVTRMLEEAVNNGTGKRAGISDMLVAGKTGTSGNKEQSSSLAFFAGYVPADAPRFVSVVIMEDAQNDQSGNQASGGSVSAPVFHNVLTKILKD